MALLYQWCWAGFLTVYTVNVNWAGHAGPQKCFSVNNIMHICAALTVYTVQLWPCVFTLSPFMMEGKTKKMVACFDFNRYRMLLHKLS